MSAHHDPIPGARGIHTVTRELTEDEGHILSSEASTLGIRPGQWPETVILTSDEDEDGGSSREGFLLLHGLWLRDELIEGIYRSARGNLLHIVND